MRPFILLEVRLIQNDSANHELNIKLRLRRQHLSAFGCVAISVRGTDFICGLRWSRDADEAQRMMRRCRVSDSWTHTHRERERERERDRQTDRHTHTQHEGSGSVADIWLCTVATAIAFYREWPTLMRFAVALFPEHIILAVSQFSVGN